jgi:hypothetical protein
MPRTPVDYSKTVIYKIVCNDLTISKLYIGSTTNFIKRKSAHKRLSNDENRNLYAIIRENGLWDNWTMVELEKFPCADGNEARGRERYWIECLIH